MIGALALFLHNKGICTYDAMLALPVLEHLAVVDYFTLPMGHSIAMHSP